MLRVTFILFLLLGLLQCANADSTNYVDDRFNNRSGIGISLETLINLDIYGNSSGGKVYFPIKYKSTLLEPLFGVYHLHRTERGYEGQQKWEDFRTYTLGFGWFAIKRIRKVDWMFGFRLEKQWRREDSNYSYNEGLIKSNELVLSPTIAAEYAFNGGFSIGGEVEFKSGHFQQDMNNNSYSSQRTKTSVMLKYYFSGERK